MVRKNGFAVIFENRAIYARINPPPHKNYFMTSKPAKLKCNILFLKKNNKYVLDVHCSVRIRIFDAMTLIIIEPKPL